MVTKKNATIKTTKASPAKLVTVPVFREWIATEEAMVYLACKRAFLDSLSSEGKIIRSKIGKMVFYNVKSINRLLEKSVDNREACEIYSRFNP